MGVTLDLSEFCSGITVERIPPEVVGRARLLVLDLVGNIVRGHGTESTPAMRSAIDALGLAQGTSRVFGDRRTFAPLGAALLQGTLAHSLDFDDTHAAATLHPGAPVIPAALAAAEMADASGATTVAAIVAGYEVICRVALALPAGDHYQRGFHPSATCGAFGAAAAAARVLGLDAAGVASALGIALSQAAGSLQFLQNGAWTKRFQVGWSAMAGLAAATLAGKGFKGAADAIEGEHGFLRAYAPAPTPARATQNLGVVYELMATGVKPYPSCRYGHAGIDAALALRSEHGLQPDEISEVVYGLSKAGMLLVGAPAAKKADPQNIVDAQFSGPFVLSAALATGAMKWDSYELLHDARIRRLLPKVRCEYDPEIEAEFPVNMSGKLTVHARGQVFAKKVVVPKGEPGNFLSGEELAAKFADLAQPVLGAARTARLAEGILGIDRLQHVSELFDLGAVPA
ncbi:MAG TPA: MmgE/PrpD family protein [Steroidobacteraceae bacterium]|jgi:2-methylcitrate dehydratase PrpD|nr:MmgE/PrpD family protein [Steroidobacteraceae bacterium]